MRDVQTVEFDYKSWIAGGAHDQGGHRTFKSRLSIRVDGRLITLTRNAKLCSETSGQALADFLECPFVARITRD